MTENSLVDRLRFAKKELTALKTAHLHGLNTLKVFRYDSEVRANDGSVRFIVDFDKNFAAYPLVEFCAISGDIQAFLDCFTQYKFTNDGYTMEMAKENVYFDTTFAVISTSPIVGLDIRYSGA